jgi:hypothetical protein
VLLGDWEGTRNFGKPLLDDRDVTKDLVKALLWDWEGNRNFGKPPLGEWDAPVTKELGKPLFGAWEINEDLPITALCLLGRSKGFR